MFKKIKEFFSRTSFFGKILLIVYNLIGVSYGFFVCFLEEHKRYNDSIAISIMFILFVMSMTRIIEWEKNFHKIKKIANSHDDNQNK